MASKYANVRDRIKQGEAAKERVQSRLSAGRSSSDRSTSKYDAVRSRAAGLQPTNTRPDVLERQQQLQEQRLNPTGTPGTYTPPPPAQQPTRLPSFQEQIANATRFEGAAPPELPGRDLPIVGPVLRGLDAFSENPVVETVGEIGGMLYTPGAGLANITAAQGAVRSGISRVAPRVGLGEGLGARVAQEAITEGALGAPLAVGNTLAYNPGASNREIASSAALGAAGGAAGGALGPLLSAAGRRVIDRYRPAPAAPEVEAPTLALPEGRPRGNANTATPPDVVTPEYIFGLPEGSPVTENRARNASEARADLAMVDDELRQLQSSYDRAVVDEYNYLKSSLDGRGGVSQGGLIRGADGAVTGRYGRQSNNPLWYREFFAQNGRKPTNKELYDLARQRVDNGFTDEAGDIPSWREQNGYDDTLAALSGVRDQITASLREIDPAINITDSPLVSRELSFRRRATEAPEGAAPRVAAPEPAAARPVTPPAAQRTEQPATGERSFFSNLESGDLTPEVRAGLQNLDRRYQPITNADTVARANRMIERRGVDETEAALLNKKKFTADDVATGMRLIQELQGSGHAARAVTIAEKLAAKLTEAGQTVQAASIWSRLSPEGALLAAQRKVNQVNESLLRGETPVKISEQQAQAIQDAAATIQAAGASRERAADVLAILDKARRGGELTKEERQFVADFIQDAKQFVKKEDTTRPQRDAVRPAEMRKPGVRTRVESYLNSQELAARERIRARRGRLSSTPLDEWADYVIVGASKLAKGALKFSDWSASMARDYGTSIQPQLRKLYQRSIQMFRSEAKRISQQKITEAEKIAEKYIEKNEARLSPEDISLVQDVAMRVANLSGDQRRLASQELQSILNSFERAGVGRKLATLQYIAMLLNPLTQIRNIVGNELMYRLERMQRIVATPIDIAASRLTGRDRQITFRRGPGVFDDFFKPAGDFWGGVAEGAKAGWRGVSPEGLQSKYEIMGQAFRSKYNPITYFEKALGAAMQGFDYAAYRRATNQRLSEMAYLDALNKGIKGDEAIRSHMMQVMTNLDDTVHQIASEYGKFATLQNDTVLSRGIMDFRKWLNKVTTIGHSENYGAGSVVLPFAKTPANLLLRNIDYSPLGIIKALNQTFSILRDPKTDLTRADVIESVSRSLLGTGIGAVALWAADKGALWGKSNKDPEVRKLMQASGQTDFQLNGSAFARMLRAAASGGDIDEAAKIRPGDTLWAYEWAAPTSAPIAMGASLYQGGKGAGGALGAAANASLSGLNTLYDSSLLSSLNELFSAQPGNDNPVGTMFMNLIKQVPGQFVPSLLRQANNFFDDTTRETYAMKSDILGQITNYAESQLPGAAQKLPQKVSTLGEPQTRLNSFADIFLSPAARSKYKPTPEAQLVIDLINETGDNSVAPRAVAKYISGTDAKTGETRRVDLSPDQYVRLQQIVGEETLKRLRQVNPGWTTEQKTEFITKSLTEAGKLGRNTLKSEFGLKVSR